MLSTISPKRDYYLIGRVLYKTRPDIATEIEKDFKDSFRPLSDIELFFSKFLSLKINQKECDSRRQFCAAMLKLYYPYVLSTGDVVIKRGFTHAIKTCFGCKKQSVFTDIREAIIMYKAYEDFKLTVDDIIKKLCDG
jgi:hypothetical protein